jgi:CheY-like chemotaxis protein
MKTSDLAILVIDDDSQIVDLTTAYLRRAGFTVFGTTNPEEAIRLVETQHSIKLVLSDMSMPGMTGPEFVRRALKLRDGDVRVLFMSGGFEGMRFRQTDRLLDKPLSLKSLVAEIRTTLANPPLLPVWVGPERRRQPHN